MNFAQWLKTTNELNYKCSNCYMEVSYEKISDTCPFCDAEMTNYVEIVSDNALARLLYENGE